MADCVFATLTETTSANVHQLPYEVEVLVEITGPSESIFDLEQYFRKQTKKYRYLPELSFGGSALECFKCSKNNKLIKEILE